MIEAHYFGAGKKVNKHSWSDTTKPGAEFTIHRLPGVMYVSKEAELPLSRFEGVMLNAWVHKRCGANSTAGDVHMGYGRIKLEVKSGKMYKTAQTTTSFESCNCEDGQCPAKTDYTPTRWTEYASDKEITEQQIHFYSDLILGSAVYQPAIPDKVKVEYSGMLHPKNGGKEIRLLCMSSCIDGSKDPIQYFPSPTVNSRDNAKEYTFNEETGVLKDPNGFPVTDPSNINYGPGSDMSMYLFEPSEAAFQTLGCAGSDTSIACPRSVWGVFPRYRWSPVSGDRYLTDSAGNVRIPDDALILKVEIPKGVNPRSLSGISYAGKSLQIRYENGHIAGLPAVCQNKQTFEYRVADYDIWGDVMHARCDYDNAEVKVSDLLLPAGIMAVREDLFTGTTTEYVLKPTRVLQKLRSSKDGMASCADALPPPEDATFPTLDVFDDESFLNMATRPAADAVLVKVEAGELVVAAEDKEE
jgi:hypothetical protein